MFREKIAIVTGAACHTGFAIAQELLRHGAIVYVNDRDEQSLIAAVAKLGECARAAAADLSDVNQIHRMMEKILAQAGRVDILVNNACHLGIGPSFVQTPMELLDEVFAVNVRSMFLLSQLVASNMIAHKSGGSIVNISSGTAARAIRNRAAYITSKGAVDALTRAMAIELAPHGIRVNAIVPGFIHTTRWETLDESTRQRRRKNIPLGREACPDDIAQSVAFLCSPGAGNIVGASLAIDGGILAQNTPIDTEV